LFAYSKGKLFEAFACNSIGELHARIHARIASSGAILWKVAFQGDVISTIPTVARAFHSRVDVAELLIKHGADVNAQARANTALRFSEVFYY
jgi:hypothetical protein